MPPPPPPPTLLVQRPLPSPPSPKLLLWRRSPRDLLDCVESTPLDAALGPFCFDRGTSLKIRSVVRRSRRRPWTLLLDRGTTLKVRPVAPPDLKPHVRSFRVGQQPELRMRRSIPGPSSQWLLLDSKLVEARWSLVHTEIDHTKGLQGYSQAPLAHRLLRLLQEHPENEKDLCFKQQDDSQPK